MRRFKNFFSFCTFIIASFGLIEAEAQLNYGATVALGASTVTNHEGNSLRAGAFNIGGFASYAVADAVSVVGEVSLANRGDKYKLDMMTGVPPFVFDVSYDGKLAMSYLQLALLALFMSDVIAAGGGFYVGTLVSAKDKGTGTVNGQTEDYDEDWKDEAEVIDLGLQLEALYKITDMISAGVVGQVGLTKVYESTTDDPKNIFVGLKARVRLSDN